MARGSRHCTMRAIINRILPYRLRSIRLRSASWTPPRSTLKSASASAARWHSTARARRYPGRNLGRPERGDGLAPSRSLRKAKSLRPGTQCRFGARRRIQSRMTLPALLDVSTAIGKDPTKPLLRTVAANETCRSSPLSRGRRRSLLSIRSPAAIQACRHLVLRSAVQDSSATISTSCRSLAPHRYQLPPGLF
jgi:hypothetical protein